MRQFAVCRNPGASASRAPLLVNLQSDLFESSTLVVAPLVEPEPFGPPITRLNPSIHFEDEIFIFSPLELTAVNRHVLPSSSGDIGDQRDAIMSAIDMVFTGF